MHRNGELDVVEFLHQRDNGAADRLHAQALILAPVRGEEDAAHVAPAPFPPPQAGEG